MIIEVPTELESCPMGTTPFEASNPGKTGTAGCGSMEVSFEKLVEITSHIELTVRIDAGPWWSAELEELQVSACQIDGDLMEQLEIKSVTAALEVLACESWLGGNSYAAAVRILALNNTGRLREALDGAARWGEGPWDDLMEAHK